MLVNALSWSELQSVKKFYIFMFIFMFQLKISFVT